ncbi:hypothetical protein RBSH_02755 [Rhodopirellula baltica SH28]|uniref:Uncharacterized protein n=1 Tax=Rhodopirellula baltica SH28 TaxID=993517 RepID=K5CDW7_RHOBT|nr:hypothetical protein RBSH_02755 [Rhodopirellula baltica SH28]
MTHCLQNWRVSRGKRHLRLEKHFWDAARDLQIASPSLQQFAGCVGTLAYR